MDHNTALRYPVLLVHGMGFRDNKVFNYWGRIPSALEEMGCRVFYGCQDSNATIETNAMQLKCRMEEILRQTGAEKLNIIAHSKGGLDSRYAITHLEMGAYVASLTTVSTPHHGSKTVDWLLKAPDWLVRRAGSVTDLAFRIAGDYRPDSYRVFHCLTTKEAEKFNRDTPDVPGVYYQSYAFVMKHPGSDFFQWLTNFAVGCIEGENDGLLTPDAVRWGHFRGIYRGAGRRGISHLDEIDFRRRPFSKRTGEGVSDILDVYRQIIRDLKEMDF